MKIKGKKRKFFEYFCEIFILYLLFLKNFLIDIFLIVKLVILIFIRIII